MDAPAAESRIGFVVQARMGSTRLPGKMLMDLRGEPLLAHTLRGLAASRIPGPVILATTTNPEDDPLADIAAGLGCRVFRGSPLDVLDRYRQAARAHGLEHVVRVTGDCPLIQAEICDDMVRRCLEADLDFLRTGASYPNGFDCEVMRASALEAAWAEARLPSEREHVSGYLSSHPERFRIRIVEHEPDLGFLRFTVDEPEDLALVRAVLEAFPAGRRPGAGEVVDYLLAHPEVRALNSRVVRDAGYLKSLEEDRAFLADQAARKADAGG